MIAGYRDLDHDQGDLGAQDVDAASEASDSDWSLWRFGFSFRARLNTRIAPESLPQVVMQFAQTKPVKSAWSSRETFDSTLVFLDEFHGHVAQLGINPAPSQQRPPIVKIDLHGSPHGNPSGNREALPHDGSPSARLMTQQDLAEN